jgi:hypothetical protein
MTNAFITLILGTILVSHGSCQTKNSVDVVGFTKRIYNALGTKNPSDLAIDFKEEYANLNNIDGALGEKLNGLYEMRMEDLQISVRHARKMRYFLDILEDVHPDVYEETDLPA